jgi:hypothetical protein
MHKARNTILSIGAAIASTKLASLISGLEFDDVLRPLGLSRRRTRWPENLAYLGAGIALGGVTALLLAPSSGQEVRQRLVKKADELSGAAVKKVTEISEELRDESIARRDNGDMARP